MTKLFASRSYILMAFAVFVICLFLGFYALIRLNTNEKISQLNELQAYLDELNRENAEVQYLLNEADEDVLYERLARQRGYVYADEKVYYDVTPGK